jgi:hypothetical protein
MGFGGKRKCSIHSDIVGMPADLVRGTDIFIKERGSDIPLIYSRSILGARTGLDRRFRSLCGYN